jgi:hypothetical protein
VPPASDVTVDVYNSGQTPDLAGDLSAALVKKGYRAGAVAEYPTALPLTTITYGTGAAAQANAEVIAKDLGLTATASSSVAAGHVQVILGASVTALPASLSAQPTASPSSTSTATTGNTANTGNSNVNTATTPLEKQAQAEYGIPCVY